MLKNAIDQFDLDPSNSQAKPLDFISPITKIYEEIKQRVVIHKSNLRSLPLQDKFFEELKEINDACYNFIHLTYLTKEVLGKEYVTCIRRR